MWACQQADISPDLLCIAKGFTGGMLPMAATLATPRIFDGFLGDADRAFYYGHSFCGNPLGAAVAREVLRVFDEEKVLEGIAPRAASIARAFDDMATLPGVTRTRQLGMIGALDLAEGDGYLARAGWRVFDEARRRGPYLRPLAHGHVAPPVNIRRTSERTAGDARERCRRGQRNRAMNGGHARGHTARRLAAVVWMLALGCGSDAVDEARSASGAADRETTTPANTAARANTATQPSGDTLGGFSLAGLRIAREWILEGGPKRDQIRGIDAPSFVSQEEANSFTASDTPVLGVMLGDVARVHPVHVIERHQVVNDVMGDVPVVVYYDPLAGTPVAARRRIGDRTLTFGVSGLVANGTSPYFDRETESLWSPLAGDAIAVRSLAVDSRCCACGKSHAISSSGGLPAPAYSRARIAQWPTA